MVEYSVTTIGAVEALRFFNSLDGITKAAIEEALEELAKIAEGRIRSIIVGGTSYGKAGAGNYVWSTGRLLASVGHYDPRYLLSQSLDPGDISSPEDAYFDIKHVGDTITVIVGTNVPYAIYIEEGFTMTGPRRVRFPDGQFRTVQTFSFEGLHAFAQGLVTLGPLANILIGKRMEDKWRHEFEYVKNVRGLTVLSEF